MKQLPIFRKSLVCIVFGFLFSAGLFGQSLLEPEIKEHIYVHTDRDLFVAGEYMYFSMYLFSSATQPEQKSKYAYLALRSASGVVERLTLKLGNGEANGAIYLHDTLSTGFYELVGFTNWMRNGPEDAYFRKPVFIANRFDDKLDIITRPLHDVDSSLDAGTEKPQANGLRISVPSRELGKRTNASLVVEPTGIPGSKADVSISIAQSATLLNNNEFVTGSLTTTQAGQQRQQQYIMETDNLILSGQVVAANDNSPQPEQTILLSVPDTLPNLKYTLSNEEGYFHFLLNDYFYDKVLFLSVKPGEETVPTNIILSDKFDFTLPMSTPDPSVLWEKRDIIRQSQDMVRIQKTYGVSHMQKQEAGCSQNSPPPKIFSQANIMIYSDHYIPLDDIYEMVREIIPAWRLRRSGGVISHNLTNVTTRASLPGQPVFFLDGIFAHDPVPYFDLSSPEIYKIEILNKEWMHGELYFPGIIHIVSHQAEVNLEKINGKYVRTVLESPAPLVDFSPPDYDRITDNQPHMPDIRQLIHWQPSLRLQNGEPAQIHFSTSDIGGEYVITIKGVTSTGEPIFQQETIFVQ